MYSNAKLIIRTLETQGRCRTPGTLPQWTYRVCVDPPKGIQRLARERDFGRFMPRPLKNSET